MSGVREEDEKYEQDVNSSIQDALLQLNSLPTVYRRLSVSLCPWPF
jgi:hypothetical protein